MTLGLSVQKKFPREQKAVIVSSTGQGISLLDFNNVQEDGVRTFKRETSL